MYKKWSIQQPKTQRAYDIFLILYFISYKLVSQVVSYLFLFYLILFLFILLLIFIIYYFFIFFISFIGGGGGEIY